MKAFKALTVSGTACALLTSACIKTYIPIPPPPPSSTSLAINSIRPASGLSGINDTITGSGFSAAIANDSVFFNGKSANIVSVSTTQLIVVVPASAGTGNVSVDVSGKAAIGPVFTFSSDTASYVNDTAYTVSTLFSGTFDIMSDIALDLSGNLIIVDYGNTNVIRKITPTGIMSVFAGSGQNQNTDGVGINASFFLPDKITIDANGNFYVSEGQCAAIRKITPNAAVSTFAGGLAIGYKDATGTAALFNGPGAITCDNQGNAFVWDWNNKYIRKITPAAVVTTFVGSGTMGTADGTGSAASFGGASGLCVDAANNIYFADEIYNTIRKITPAGVVTTFAGVADGSGNFSDVDGVGTQAKFAGPQDIASDKYGNLYVCDGAVHGATVRKITPAGVVTTIAGIAGVQGSADGPGHQATFSLPYGIVVAPNGVVYVLDEGNNAIRVLTPIH